MTLDELIKWCDPDAAPETRPPQNAKTWRELTDALRDLKARREADQADAAQGTS